ncbi:MAG: hypothetical protein KDD06_04150 [Phaeodactylibacter sp.]|nr:hypothetical protein [Phaeodactylibacter sp.]
MNSLFKISVLLLFAGLLSTASKKENTDRIVAEASVYQPDTVEANNLMTTLQYNMYAWQIDAIDIIYPISATLKNNGNALEFNNDVEGCAFIYNCG